MEDLDALAGRLGWDFRDRSLLFQSLIHRSFLNENPGTRLKSNERLEFLGDAVLDALAAEFLFLRCPDKGEGELTLWRSALVRTETLAAFAARFDLGRYLVMGRGEEADGGRTRTTILADAFEAVLGAVYLDGGLEATRSFFTPFMEEAMVSFGGRLPVDYKSTLQIEVQGRAGITPQYRTAAAWGPDHARMFQVEVWAGDRLLGRGEGLSKQAAQQEAARAALEELQAAEAAPDPAAGEEPPQAPRRPRAAPKEAQPAPEPAPRRPRAAPKEAPAPEPAPKRPRAAREKAQPAPEPAPKRPRAAREKAQPAPEPAPKRPRAAREKAQPAPEPAPRRPRAAREKAQPAPEPAPKRPRAAREKAQPAPKRPRAGREKAQPAPEPAPKRPRAAREKAQPAPEPAPKRPRAAREKAQPAPRRSRKPKASGQQEGAV